MTSRPRPAAGAAAPWLVVAREDRGDWDPGRDHPGSTRDAGDLINEVSGQVADLRGLLAPADVYDGATTDQLRRHLDDLKTLSGLATAATAKAARAFARAGGLREDGTASTRNQFRKDGHSNRDAARLAKLASGLDDKPATADALASGDITAEAAADIVDAIGDGRLGDDPEQVERDLLAHARDTSPEDLRRHVRREQQRRDGDALRRDEERQRRRRAMSIHQQPDGMWSVYGLLPSEDGERAKTLLDALTTRDPAGTPDDAKRSSVQRTADAFTDAVDWMLDHRDLPTTQGRSRPHVVVTVDADTACADMTDPDTGEAVRPDDPRWADMSPGQPAWGDRPLSPQTVRRICCDANLTRLITDAAGMPLDVGTATRKWSAAQRIAITHRDGGCRGPSCDRPVGWAEIHHITWARHDGPTDLDNGLLLCRKCHDLIHHDGWAVHLHPTDATATWTSPSGRTVTTRPRRSDDRRRRPA